jgi:hypothetical protein
MLVWRHVIRLVCRVQWRFIAHYVVLLQHVLWQLGMVLASLLWASHSSSCCRAQACCHKDKCWFSFLTAAGILLKVGASWVLWCMPCCLRTVLLAASIMLLVAAESAGASCLGAQMARQGGDGVVGLAAMKGMGTGEWHVVVLLYMCT